ncbi:MAG: rhomboid family intramembrane serine protease [Cyanobacteria bacterium]|nr:rhomboid family intramembrane serine protease [Cyanobacteriota bacterium]
MTADDPNLKAKLDQLTAEVEQNYRAPSGSPPPASDGQATAPRPTMMARWKQNALIPLYILAIPWAQEIIDQVFFGGRWNLPIHPRTIEGLPGIIFAAFSHGGFGHLIGNSIAFTIFSWLILVKSRRDFWITFCIGWLGGGAVSWLLGPTSVHGLSGVVYTLFGYLLVIGWLERRIVPLAISVFVLANYSYQIWGIFPTNPMVAWWGHLFGLILGIVAAYGLYREPQPKG